MNLIDLKVGERAIIKEIRCSDLTKERLHTMALVRGVLIEYKGSSPLHSPRIYAYLNTQVAIRSVIARKIEVEKQ